MEPIHGELRRERIYAPKPVLCTVNDSMNAVGRQVGEFSVDFIPDLSRSSPAASDSPPSLQRHAVAHNGLITLQPLRGRN